MKEIKLNKEHNYIHLLSGGLDSSYSLLKTSEELKKDVKSAVIHPIFFDYGHKAADIEWERVKKIIKYIRSYLNDDPLIDDPLKISLKSDLFKWSKSDAFWGKEGCKNPEIENRNMVLFSVLASYLMACANRQGIESTEFEINSGFKEDELADSTNAFFTKFESLLNLYKKDLIFRFNILSPMDRKQIVKKVRKLLKGDGKKLGLFLQLITSCYSPNEAGEPCCECSKCESLRYEKKKMKF